MVCSAGRRAAAAAALRPAAPAAALLLLSALGGAGASGLDDAGALVQQTLSVKGKGVLETGRFDCKAHPELCVPPFDCQRYSPVQAAIRSVTGVQHADLGLWCEHPEYGLYVNQCLAKRDMVSAAWLQYKLSVAGVFGKDTAELDASYCFLEGMCVQHEVTKNTTLQEGEALCDKRLGPHWRAWSGPQSPPEDSMGFAPGPKSEDAHNGFTHRGQSRPYVVAACAMGNYHCDVMYCRVTYCSVPYYQNKYGHLLVENGWR